MCQNNSEIKFCTCGDEAEIESNTYTWSLNRLVGKKTDTMVGKVAMPEDDLGGGITAEKILTLMNESKCFDFEYTPRTDDTLHVYSKASGSRSGFFTLLFQNGQWQTGNNPPFISIKENIAKGILKKENAI